MTPRFRIRDESIQGERHQLLNEKGVLFTEPLLEPVADYLSYHTVGQVASEIGLDDEQANSTVSDGFRRGLQNSPCAYIRNSH